MEILEKNERFHFTFSNTLFKAYLLFNSFYKCIGFIVQARRRNLIRIPLLTLNPKKLIPRPRFTAHHEGKKDTQKERAGLLFSKREIRNKAIPIPVATHLFTLLWDTALFYNLIIFDLLTFLLSSFFFFF